MTNNVTIYQITNTRDTDYAFCGWEKAKNVAAGKSILTDYTAVAHLNYRDVDNYDCVSDFLESLYATYNSPLVKRPDNMRSLSVSDIVQVGDSYYYCDNFSWVDITDKIF